MGDNLLAFIKEVSIFVVCAQMIMHFKPTAQYGKYIKLLIGIMVLAKLFVPITSIFGKGGEAVFSQKLDYYQEMVANSMAEAGLESVATAERVEEMRLEEVKSILNNSEGQAAVVQREENMSQGEIYIERIEVGPDD